MMSFSTTTSASDSAGWLRGIFNWIRSRNAVLNTAKSEDSVLIFVSLGLAVIDEIHFGSERAIRDVLGGSGTYGMLLTH